METTSQPKKYLNYGALKKRAGWSEKVIAHFLPTPDSTRTNPHYRSAAPIKLYLLERIEEVEKREDWQQQAQRTNSRKQSAGLATATKRANLLGYVESLVIKVPVLEIEELTELACAHYNARKAWQSYEYVCDTDWQEATPNSDRSFLNRISTNYLRHMLTRYEQELERIAGKVGVDEAYNLLKEKVNQAIYQQYPHLAA